MAEVSIDLNMVRVTNDAFVEKAEACAPKLLETVVRPVSIVDIVKTENVYPDVNKKDDIENLSSYHLAKGDKICLDFGDHQVGYVTMKLNSVGSPQDAPAFFRLKFAEIAKEITENSKDYDGWISRGWIQEEFIHVDVLPAELKLPRRYAFRYMEIEAIYTQPDILEDTLLGALAVVEQAIAHTDVGTFVGWCSEGIGLQFSVWCREW